nr:hypothetical protein [Micromonospora sp. DSM 115978]
MATTGSATSDGVRGDVGQADESLSRRQLVTEVWLVFGVSLGASALFSLIRYIGVLTADASVRSQVARLNSSAAPGRPWLDLALQLASVAVAVVPAVLAVHLLTRSGGGRQSIGLDTRQPRRDLAGPDRPSLRALP